MSLLDLIAGHESRIVMLLMGLGPHQDGAVSYNPSNEMEDSSLTSVRKTFGNIA
jgi:hypothetical protein